MGHMGLIGLIRLIGPIWSIGGAVAQALKRRTPNAKRQTSSHQQILDPDR